MQGVYNRMDGECMAEIEGLKDRVEYIEREEIVKMKEDITDIKMNQVETNTLVKEFSKSVERQCATMEVMATSMQEMSLNMRDNNNSIKDLNTKFTCFEDEMCNIKEDIKVQKSAKFEFIKNNIWQIVGIVATLSVLVYVVLGKIGL